MLSKDYLPAGALAGYINQYRLRHFVFSNGIIPSPKPFPPRPEQCLTFYIRGGETCRRLLNGILVKKPRSVLSGQFTYRIDRYVSCPEILMLIVDFKPGALHRLTGIPFAAFRNNDIDAELVFPCEIKRVNERLANTESYEDMIRIVEAFFLHLDKQCKKEILPLDNLINSIAHHPDRSVDWLARNAFLSPRQLERKFDERVGISPKCFLRISRFNQSYWLHLKNKHLSWFDIAMSCGYTDYQHMVKEYYTFTNRKPSQFFAEESNAPGRILGLTR